MPTLVIVGFQYDETERELLSMITDVYLVYSHFRNLGARVYFASDAKTVKYPQKTTEYLVSGIVDEGYFNFVERNFMNLKTHVRTSEELRAFFKSVKVTEDRRLIIYYTGHGHTAGIYLPDESTLLVDDFRGLILNIGNQEKPTRNTDEKLKLSINCCLEPQTLVIMDCCNPHGLYLPYKITQDGLESKNSNLFIFPEIIMLVPCEFGQPVLAHESVSPFTQKLILHLRDSTKLVDLKSIIKSTSTETQSVAYTTYPNLTVLWPWTFTQSIDCRVDERLDAIVLTWYNK